MPSVRYQICYRTVEELRTGVRYRSVQHTVMNECRYTTCRPVYEQHVRECRYTVCKPVYEDYDVVRKYTTCKPVYEQHVRGAATPSRSRSTKSTNWPCLITRNIRCTSSTPRECRYTVMKCYEDYQVRIRWTALPSCQLRAARA